MKRVFETTIAGRPLSVETGQLAQFANGVCLIRYGETVILANATASDTPRSGIDYFPLSVDYEEKHYSVGKIPGGFIKREGRPTEKAVLTSRLIDRPIRPLFPSDLRNDVAVNNLVLSVEQDCAPDITAMLGTSIALAISDIPWNGPIAGVHLGLINDQVIINPDEKQREMSRMHVTLVGTADKICMIEAGANEVPEDAMLDAIAKGHEAIKEIIAFIESIASEIGKEKFDYVAKVIPEDFMTLVQELVYTDMRQAILSDDKSVRDAQVAVLRDRVTQKLEELENSEWLPLVGEAIYRMEKKVVREYLFKEHRRVDGRSLDQIRALSADVSILPRTHGSGLFQRGQTQVLTTCTLGSLSKVQMLDGLDNEEEKRYMHHYNFPGYSVGEAKFARSPGRREIGHGALAERSLLPVLPDEVEFPYAIRCVSEILMSNGSTSQGSVCASSLALMDAGVPIKRPVAGISAGLIVNEENDKDYLVFMDIQGIEDFFGDMDFKVAGTTEGITSIQVDIKVDGLSMDIIRDAFEMTRKGRLQIIDEVILPCIGSPREVMSRYAPKITQIKIPVDKIREVIGQGGKVINRIIEETGVEIDIEDDGRVFILSPNADAAEKATSIIKGIANDPEIGEIFDGHVTRLMSFGAFVEFLPGKEGLVHISKMDWKRVERVEDVVKEGDAVKVKVLEIDGQGRINLSIRDTTEKPEGYSEVDTSERRPRSDHDRGDRGDRGGRPPRGNFDRGSRGPDRGGRSGSDRGGSNRDSSGPQQRNQDRPPRTERSPQAPNNDGPQQRNERQF